MRKILLSLIGLITLFQAEAQQVYKGLGTSGSTFLFSQPTYAAKSQCIFLPADLTNATSGNITTLYYRYGSVTADQKMYNFTIKMGQTTSTSFVGNNTFFTGLTTVLTDTAYFIPQGPSGNWFPIVLDSPFAYDATQTLIIQLTFGSVMTTSWLTLGTSNNPVKKVISADTNAVTGSGTSGTWQDMGFDLAPAGVNELQGGNSLQLFPNPAQQQLTIFSEKSNSVSATSFEIVNNVGEVVKQIKLISGRNTSIDVADLPRGVYFVRRVNDTNFSVQKLVLN